MVEIAHTVVDESNSLQCNFGHREQIGTRPAAPTAQIDPRSDESQCSGFM
jgi:hypothetical protein